MVSINYIFRSETEPEDVGKVGCLCRAAGNFSVREVELAKELVREDLAMHKESGYYFLFADWKSRLLGFICYGPIPCTTASWEVYWIVVDPVWQGLGLGGELLREAEKRIANMGGSRIYIETSSKTSYQQSRNFYKKQGYLLQAELSDFYDSQDDKLIYAKIIPMQNSESDEIPYRLKSRNLRGVKHEHK